jgi:hypothetical protein
VHLFPVDILSRSLPVDLNLHRAVSGSNIPIARAGMDSGATNSHVVPGASPRIYARSGMFASHAGHNNTGDLLRGSLATAMATAQGVKRPMFKARRSVSTSFQPDGSAPPVPTTSPTFTVYVFKHDIVTPFFQFHCFRGP